MSTIASPRIPDGLRSPSSSRSSLSLDRQSLASTGQRRNRAALRDYYGLQAAAPADVAVPNGTEEQTVSSELDKSDFEPSDYVSKLLATDGLEAVLRVESSLVGEIRGLDGERKALVYDNYSKLIAATDTIRRMRTNMDPLAPMTTTLEPAMGHIAQIAMGLRDDLRSKTASAAITKPVQAPNGKIETVRWVMDTPRRLEELIRQGKKDDAELDWAEIKSILQQWEGVTGVDEIQQKAEALIIG